MRTVIVEDHLMFRDVLRKLCTGLRHEVVGEADRAETAVELVRQIRPDLLLLDLHLPGPDGFAVIAVTQRLSPKTRILVLSSHCDDFTVHRVEQAGVHGYVDKNTSAVADLTEAIARVARGERTFSPEFERVRAKRHADPTAFDKLLTKREQSVVSLHAIPIGDDEIAHVLGISRETVEKHRQNICRKLGLHTVHELMRYAREHGCTLSSL